MDTPNRSDITVLIAEDSRIQAQILSKKLVGAGFGVRLAENGAVALESIRKERPTVVISDIEMPKMTGYELCSAVKDDADLKTIPFILLSTLSEPQDIIRGLHCGADNYVTKPYDPDFLMSRVDSLLSTPLGDDGDVQQLDGGSIPDPHILDVPVRKPRETLAHRTCERRSALTEKIDEHVPRPLFDRHAVERVVFLSKTRGFEAVRGGPQLPVE